LTGRGPLLSAALSQARADQGVVFVGPAGVGKSRLADEVCSRLDGPESTVLRLVASRAAGSMPLGALAPLLSVPGERDPDPAFGSSAQRGSALGSPPI
jgi:hypothetical protein